MKKNKSLILTVVVFLALIAAFALPVLAASDDIGSMNALDALGIDTSALPEGYDPNTTENPYGRDSVTVNPVYELFVTGVKKTSGPTTTVENITSGSDVVGTKTTVTSIFSLQNLLYGHNKALNKTLTDFYTSQGSQTFNEEAYTDKTVTLTYPSYSVENTRTTQMTTFAATATASGNFIGNEASVGKQGQVVTVGAGSLSKNGGLYLYFADAVTGSMSGAKTLLDTSAVIGNSGNQMEEDFAASPYLMQNYLKVATGDFDNNGIDEVAVYVAEQGKSRVEIYRLAVTSFDTPDAYLNADSWKKVWTYYFNESPYVSNMVSLTAGDFNCNGTDDLALTWGYYYGSDKNNGCQAVVLYGSSSNMLQTKKTIDLSYNTSGIVRAAFAYGDIDGDNVNDLVLGGQLSTDIANGNPNTRFIGVYTYDGTNDRFIQSIAKNFNLFEKKDGSYVNTVMASHGDKFYSTPACVANIATVNMNGAGHAASIYLDSLLFEYGDNGLIISTALDQNTSFNKNMGNKQKYYVEYGIVAADFTGAGKETLQVMQYYVPVVATQLPPYLAWWYHLLGIPTDDSLPGDLDMLGVYGGSGGIAVNRTTDVNFTTSFCKLNTDQDTSLLKYTGTHYIRYTDPRVLAVMSSAPYFADLDNDALSGSYMESETSYTSTTGSGTGSSTSNTLNIGAYVSFEHDFEVFGCKVASIETELSYEHGWTWETVNSSTLEQSISYATSAGSDAVAFYSIPMETYVYESLVPIINETTGVCSGYDVQHMSVNIPHIASVKVLPLDTYEKIAADYAELPKIAGDVLTHTVGDPATYPSSASGYSNAISYNGDWSGVNFGLGSVTQEISMTSETEKSYTNTNTVEAKVGAGPGDFVFGISAGYEHGSSQVTVTTSGSSFVGQVYNMPKEAEPYGYNYVWKVFSYQYSGNGYSFPVVDYLVTDVTAPPKLPTDFQQDMTGTTDKQIKLTWSYDGAAAGFQIYRYYVFPDGSGSYELAFVPASDAVDVDAEDGTRYFQYIDTGLDPYTEYDYQIQVVGASQPTDSILSAVYTAKTKIDMGYPDISLTGVENGTLLVYPDSVSTVTVNVTNITDYSQTPRYQWQKLTDIGWIDIAGAINTSYTFKSAGLADEGQYRCRVNAIYNSFYLSAYSETFTLQYAKRIPVVVDGGFTVIDTTVNSQTVPKISISLKSKQQNHHAAPTGNVTFTITGADYSKAFTVALVPDESAESEGTSTASLTLDSSLPEGVYEITAYYSGSRVFQSLTTENAIPYLSGSGSGYVLTLDSSYTYGDPFNPTLKSVQKTDGITTTSAVEGTVNYQVIQYVWETAFDNDYGYYVWLDPQVISNFTSDSSVTATQAGSFTLTASVGDQVVASKEFIVKQREITIGITDQNGVTGSVSHPTDSILTLENGTWANDDSIADLGLVVKAINSAGTEVTITSNDPDPKKNTDPGLYTIVGTPGNPVGPKYSNYSISYIPGTFIITGPKYSVSGIAKQVNNKDVGTIQLISPEGNDNINWTTQYASSNTLVFLATPNTGYAVKSWTVTDSHGNVLPDSGAGSTLTYVHSMKDESIIITVEFEVAQKTLSYLAAVGTGTVECTSNTVMQSGDVAMSGAEFTFKATPAAGYHFDKWQLTEIGKSPSYPVGAPNEDGSNTCQITMGSGATVLYAILARDEYTINLEGDLQASYLKYNDTTMQDELVTAVSGSKIPGDKVVTVTSKPGYAVKGDAVWTQDGQPVTTGVSGDNQSYAFTMLADTTIAAATENEHYSVNLEVAGPGSDQNSVSVTVNGVETADLSNIAGGSALVFTASPVYGYVFDKWIVNGTEVFTADDKLTIAALDQVTTVEAVFKNNNAYTISVTYGLRGSLSYTLNGGEPVEIASGETIPVFKGDDVVLTVAPEPNFMVENWKIDGVTELTNVKKWIFNEISDDITVEVVFGAQTYSTVTYDVDVNGGGAITSATSDGVSFESGDNSVGNGSELQFVAAPESGKMVDKWTLNGVDVKNDLGVNLVDTTYVIDALSGDANVVVSFKDIVTYSVAMTSYDCNIAPVFSPAMFPGGIREGASATFTVVPESGYRITLVSVTGNAGATGLDGFDSIAKQADGSWICVVNATGNDLDIHTEAKPLYAITIPVAPSGGSILTNVNQAIEGEEITLTATPRANYVFSGWTVNGGAVTLADATALSTTFIMPASNVMVAAQFTYKGGGGGGGSISAEPEEPEEPEYTVQSDGSILVALTEKKGVISQVTNEKLIELNKTKEIVISGNGVRIVIPVGMLKDGIDINDLIPQLPDNTSGSCWVVVYSDASGNRHIVPWSLVGTNGVSFIIQGGGQYEIIDNSQQFNDISGHWSTDAINFVAAHNLFTGMSENEFSPNSAMTRAMLVTVLHRLNGLTSGEGETFSDVTDGEWYANAVGWAAANNIVGGYGDGSFGTNDNITREQLASILYRYAKYIGTDTTATGDLSAYHDADSVSDYAVEAMQWATQSGLINGQPGGMLDPEGNASRAEVAAVLMRFIDLIL